MNGILFTLNYWIIAAAGFWAGWLVREHVNRPDRFEKHGHTPIGRLQTYLEELLFGVVGVVLLTIVIAMGLGFFIWIPAVDQSMHTLIGNRLDWFHSDSPDRWGIYDP